MGDFASITMPANVQSVLVLPVPSTDFTIEPAGALGSNDQWPGVALGDVDLDGIDDVAFAGHFSGFCQVFRSNGNRTFTEISNGLPNATVLNPDGGHDMVIRDLTGDGLPDLVWTRFYAASVWAGDGQGNWTPGSGLPAYQFYGVDAGDIDGDGTLELVFGVFDVGGTIGGGGGVQVYKHVGNNVWQAMQGTGLPTSGMAMGVALLDFDRDGWLDVAVGYYESNRGLELWRNTGQGQFVLRTQSGLSPLSLGPVEELSVGDFNGDTFPDLVAAVVGEAPMVFHNLLAGAFAYGSPCTHGAFAMPSIQTIGQPAIGNQAFGFHLSGGVSNSFGLFWLGSSSRMFQGQPVLPLELSPVGAPGCHLWAEPLATVFVGFDGTGSGTVGVPIPFAPQLLWSTWFGQGANFAPSANALDFLLTAGMTVRVQ